MARKLFYVINHMDWFWSHRLPLAKAAQAAGWDVTVSATNATSDSKLQSLNFKATELPSAQGADGMLKAMLALRTLIRVQKPDLVHVITLKYALITGLAARFERINIVMTIAGLGYLFSGDDLKPRILRQIAGPLLKLAFKGPRVRLIFQNPDDQKLMLDRGFANPAQCFLIRGSGVDLEQFTFSEKPQDEIPLVLLPTRLVHDKGIAVFVEAAHILKSRGVQARFQIAGGLAHSNPRALTQAEIENLTSDGVVEWLGRVADMPALLKKASIIAYPSYYGEGVPKVLLEAAATGCPIVTTDHPGCREAVQHAHNGLLVPVKNAQATADAIASLLADPDLRARMGLNGRRLAEKAFDVRLIVEKTLQVYNS